MVLTSLNSWLGIWIIFKLSVEHCGCCLSHTTAASCSVIICPSHDLYTRPRLTSRQGKGIQEKKITITIDLVATSCFTSIRIIASALSMGDMLHCLTPKSSVCIPTTCSLIETTIKEEVMSYCYLWIFGYYSNSFQILAHLVMATRLNMGLMWWAKNHNLRGGQETFQ